MNKIDRPPTLTYDNQPAWLRPASMMADATVRVVTGLSFLWRDLCGARKDLPLALCLGGSALDNLLTFARPGADNRATCYL